MLHLAVRHYTFRDTPEEVLQGGIPDIGDVINVDRKTCVRDILKQIIDQYHPDRMVVLTPIRDEELDMTLLEWVAHSDGDTRKEHELYKRCRGRDGKICVQFYRQHDHVTGQIKVTLYNRNEVGQDNTDIFI